MGLDRGNETTTQLLTLLNVSATKAGKRKWITDDSRPKEKLNKRRVILVDEPTAVTIVERADEEEQEDAKDAEGPTAQAVAEPVREEVDEEDEEEQGAPEPAIIAFSVHCQSQLHSRRLGSI